MMMDTLIKLLDNFYYLTAMVLFIIGFHTMLTHANLIKKLLGMNIMETAIFLFFVATGYIGSGRAPIIQPGEEHLYVNPLPSALILTGIVVAVSITAYALSLIIKLYRHYGTLDANEIALLRAREEE